MRKIKQIYSGQLNTAISPLGVGLLYLHPPIHFYGFTAILCKY